MNAAEYRKWANDSYESAEQYAKWAADAEYDARFWFEHRNTCGGVNDTREFGTTGKNAYEFYRGKFLAARKSIKGWRRLAAQTLAQAAKWSEKARDAARQERQTRKAR